MPRSSRVLHLSYSLSVAVVAACGGEHLSPYADVDPATLPQRALTVPELHADVRALFATIDSLHPDLEQRFPTSRRDQLRDSLLQLLTQPLQRDAFYRVIGATTEHFRDGHTGVLSPYPEYGAFTKGGGLVFPLRVAALDGALVVTADASVGAPVPPGSRLVAINNVPADTLLAHVARYARGETLLLRQHIAAEQLDEWLWHLYDMRSPYTITYTRDSVVEAAIIEGVTRATLTAGGQSAEPSLLQYRSLGDGVGYLRVPAFSGADDDFAAALDAVGDSLRRDLATAVVIDVRDNPGGSTDAVEALLARITPTPCALVSTVREKLNPRNRGLLRRGSEIGETIDLGGEGEVKPVASGDRFPARVVVLIGPYTYSAAIVFATAVQDCGVGTLIGEETGGAANQTGQIHFFNLPYSRLRAFAPTRVLVRPSGASGSRGVVPDVPVVRSADDVAAGRDAALDAATRHLRASQP
jgi:hypothetical protein